MVHAGVNPYADLNKQSGKAFTTMSRYSMKKGDGPKTLWARDYNGPTKIVFGHDRERGFRRHRHAIGLDTGCVYGGRLTAYVLPDDRIVSINVKKDRRVRKGS